MTEPPLEVQGPPVVGARKRLSALDLARFLVGRRDAILSAAASRTTLPLGALFVLTAALAREYDGVWLRGEPGHLLLPFAASLVTSAVLFLPLCGAQWILVRHASLRGYPRFLGLYWLTAPLAWLYAIPVERFLSPVGATKANLCLLALVAARRVALMARIICVAYGLSARQAISLVLWFGSSVALLVLYFTPIPIFNVMAGIHHAPEEKLVQSTAVFVGMSSGVVWILSLLSLALGLAFEAQLPTQLPASSRWGFSVWVTGLAALGIGLTALPWTQPAQRNRWEAEHLLNANRVDEGLAYLAVRKRDDFPPHWDPPPRIGYGQRTPSLNHVLERCVELRVPDWVRRMYVAKLDTQLQGGYLVEFDPNYSRSLDMLEKLPETSALIQAHPYAFIEFSGAIKYFDPDQLPRVERLMQEAGVPSSTANPKSP